MIILIQNQNMMSKEKLYQYAVVLRPTKEEEEKEKMSAKLLMWSSEPVLAKDEKQLVFKLTREIPEQYADKYEQIEIIVRPF